MNSNKQETQKQRTQSAKKRAGLDYALQQQYYRKTLHKNRKFDYSVWELLLIIAICLCLFLLLLICIAISKSLLLEESVESEESISIVPVSVSSNENTKTKTKMEIPEWIIQDILPVNEYSRPGTKLEKVNGVVVHYIGNPGTSAEQNRNYYGELAQTHETKISSHFLIGIDGMVIQCVPLNEIAYCSNDRNSDTISIECCHPDSSGKFSKATLDSLVNLLNWLADTYHLHREHIIRHHDVTGKICPKYYVNYPEEWEHLLDMVTFSP